MKILEETMISNKDLQEQYISRVDVLDKVKDLFLIPAMEWLNETENTENSNNSENNSVDNTKEVDS